MTALEKKMKPLDDEIQRIDTAIARLQIEREAIIRARALLMGEPLLAPASQRKRSSNIKPLILDLMARAGTAGATGAVIADLVREQVPTVAKDTPGSVLSRLKADGALVYDGERYYDKRFAPKGDRSIIEGIRAVPLS